MRRVSITSEGGDVTVMCDIRGTLCWEWGVTQLLFADDLALWCKT